MRGLCRVALGPAFWIAVAFSLAALGGLNQIAVLLVATLGAIGAIGTLVARRSNGGLPSSAAKFSSSAKFSSPAKWRARPVEVVLVSLLLVPFFFLTLSPEISWDADVYHLTLPRLFIEHGGFRPVPFNVYAHWPLGTELLYALAMLAKDPILAKLVHFAFGVATLYAIAVGCREFHRGVAAPLAALLFLANPVVLTELHVAYVDLAYAFFFTAGFLFALRATAGEGDSAAHWVLAGLCCGVVGGLKVTGIVAAAVIGSLAIPALAAASRTRSLRTVVRLVAVCFALPVLVLWLPWLVKAWLGTGNPIHPFGYAFFGGVDWSAGLDHQFARWQRSIGMGRDLLDYVRLPVRVILEGGVDYAHFDGKIGAFWIAVLPLSLALGMRTRLVRCALLVSGLYFGVWALSSQQMRFLIPILPLLAMAGAAVISDGIERVGKSRAARLRTATVAVGALAFVALYQTPLRRGLAVSVRSQEEAAEQAAEVVPPVFRFVESELPEDAILLFVNTNRGFFCRREFLADAFFQASQTADWMRSASSPGALRELLDTRGVTHVLVERRNWGIRRTPALATLLRDPAMAERLYASADRRFALYALL